MCIRANHKLGAELGRQFDLSPTLRVEGRDFAGVNAEWLTWFPLDPPARQGAKMPIRIPGMLISIAVIAEA